MLHFIPLHPIFVSPAKERRKVKKQISKLKRQINLDSSLKATAGISWPSLQITGFLPVHKEGWKCLQIKWMHKIKIAHFKLSKLHSPKARQHMQITKVQVTNWIANQVQIQTFCQKLSNKKIWQDIKQAQKLSKEETRMQRKHCIASKQNQFHHFPAVYFFREVQI